MWRQGMHESIRYRLSSVFDVTKKIFYDCISLCTSGMPGKLLTILGVVVI